MGARGWGRGRFIAQARLAGQMRRRGPIRRCACSAWQRVQGSGHLYAIAQPSSTIQALRLCALPPPPPSPAPATEHTPTTRPYLSLDFCSHTTGAAPILATSASCARWPHAYSGPPRGAREQAWRDSGASMPNSRTRVPPKSSVSPSTTRGRPSTVPLASATPPGAQRSSSPAAAAAARAAQRACPWCCWCAPALAPLLLLVMVVLLLTAGARGGECLRGPAIGRAWDAPGGRLSTRIAAAPVLRRGWRGWRVHWAVAGA